MRKLQIIVSCTALLIVVVHTAKPNLTIDGITATFLVIAIIPWLAPLFKTIELPGGLKVEFQDLQNAKERAESVGLLAEEPVTAQLIEYPFQLVAEEAQTLH